MSVHFNIEIRRSGFRGSDSLCGAETSPGCKGWCSSLVPLQKGGSDQLGQLEVERASNLRREYQSDVLTTAVNAAHLRPVNACVMNQRFVRRAGRDELLALHCRTPPVLVLGHGGVIGEAPAKTSH